MAVDHYEMRQACLRALDHQTKQQEDLQKELVE